MTKKRIIIIATLLISMACGSASGQYLCSTVTAVVGYGQYLNLLPDTTFSVDVLFTVLRNSSQPFQKSIPTQETMDYLTVGGTGWTILPFCCDLLPLGGYDLDLIGTGNNYNTYKHKFTAYSRNWSKPWYSSVPVLTNWTYAPVKQYPAVNCCG